MNNLSLIQCSTLLSCRQTYQIKGVLYRFVIQDGSIKHPQFIFRPLPGQGKKADLKLNRQKLLSQCYVVPGMSAKAEVMNTQVVQMKLF
ncbi:hypothetical protein [Nostoc sp. FACHB-190]|uniref:hypothetical protein n=1 Tax=Nostoc sp. FACHB-190 TaxID=2692838 RepID=UPI00168592D5|nr:hypothetical protein [Nostoc sp. FACHB-190]MBD2303038.1 hypothetical protein [Nostoc sp. FACHB-190]